MGKNPITHNTLIFILLLTSGCATNQTHRTTAPSKTGPTQSVEFQGQSGILSAEDAVGKIRAGADVVQIYTGLIYEGPALVAKAARAIKTMD